jgi:hypothetical protein
MLAVALLFATLLDPGRPYAVAQQRAACPSTPVDAIAAPDRTCPAIEITGHIDETGVGLEPAFNVLAAPSQFTPSSKWMALANQVPPAALARLDGYADGKQLFEFAFVASGRFKLVLPLAPPLAAAMTRLTLTAGGASFELVAASPAVPVAEAIAIDDFRTLFAWNAQAFPAVRIAIDRRQEPIAIAAGSQTFQEIQLRTVAQRLVVSFSDGVHSVDRTVSVTGR